MLSTLALLACLGSLIRCEARRYLGELEMLRFVNVCLVLGLAALTYVIYQVKYDARSLDKEIVALNKSLETERDAIAVLRAEWSLLNRPERIDRLAKKYLKLAPPSPHQLKTLDTVSAGDIARFSLKTKEAETARAVLKAKKPQAAHAAVQ